MPKPDFDWEELHRVLARIPVGKRREDVPGGFTADELMAQEDIGESAATRRIARWLKGGTVRVIAQVTRTTVNAHGARRTSLRNVYDVVRPEP